MERAYPIVNVDALRMNIRDADSRAIKIRLFASPFDVTRDGLREVAGMFWVAKNE